jgi:hypothetical protein
MTALKRFSGLCALAAFAPAWALAQDITCTARECRGTDIMGNPVLLRVNSDRLDSTQSYTARIGDTEIQVERKRSPLVSADWNGPVLLQRPITTITGTANGQAINLYTESSGLTTGEAFGQPVTCAVNGWSVFSPTPCF